MKYLLILAVLGFSTNLGTVLAEEDEELYCNIRTCVFGLLNFSDLRFSTLIKKAHVATFCIRECSPPAVHEFFQSITYAITKRIPGHCSGKSCIEVNRFVGLAHCLENRSWPLVQCATRLVDLVQLSLEPVKPEEYRNKTCGIMIQAINCFEKNVEICGPKPYSLIEEIFGKVSKVAIKFFCRVEYGKNGEIIEITEPSTSPIPTTSPRIPALFSPVAKGYLRRGGNSATKSELSLVCSLSTLAVIFMTLRNRF